MSFFNLSFRTFNLSFFCVSLVDLFLLFKKYPAVISPLPIKAISIIYNINRFLNYICSSFIFFLYRLL